MTARRPYLAALAAAALLLSGCWDQRDISERTPALGMGFDRDQKGWQVTVSEVRYLSGSQPPYIGTVFIGRGRTISETLDDVRTRVGRELYVGDVKVYVLGPGALREGLFEVIDALRHNEEVDRTAFLIGSTTPPGAFLTGTSATGPTAVRLLKQFEAHTDLRDGFSEEPLWQAIRDVASPGETIQVPLFEQTGGGAVQSRGTALVGPDDHLRIELGKVPSAALRWLMNLRSREVIRLPDGQEVRLADVRTKVSFPSSGRTVVRVALSVEGHRLASSAVTEGEQRVLAQETSERALAAIQDLLHTLKQAGAEVPGWRESAVEAGHPEWRLRTSEFAVQVQTKVAPYTTPGF